MSRAFDAKQQALSAYPDDREAGIDLFLGYLECSESDFMYEYSNFNSVEEYIYGNELIKEEE